jgi:hypothetical protein
VDARQKHRRGVLCAATYACLVSLQLFGIKLINFVTRARVAVRVCAYLVAAPLERATGVATAEQEARAEDIVCMCGWGCALECE